MPLKLIKRGKYWHITGTVAGHSVRKSTGTSVRSQADIIRARTETQILERHTLGRAPTLTLAQAALTYLESDGEGRFLGQILEFFGPDTLLADVDNEAMNRAARALYPNAAPSTINRQLITPVSAVINMAADDGLCAPRRLKRRKEGKGRLRWLTPTEADTLLGTANGRTATQIAFLLGTGCRTGEMIKLDRSKLYLETGEAHVIESKNGDQRMVRFPLRTKRLLAASGLPEDGPVFRTPKGKPYTVRENGGGQIAEAFNQARDDAELGQDVTPHNLRHTWATWFWAHNKDLVQLMALGGWRTPSVALKYTKLAPATLAQDLFEHGWDFRINTKSAQAIPAPTRKQLKVIGK